MSDRTEIRVNRNLARWISLGAGLIAFVVALVNWVAVGATGNLIPTWVGLVLGVLGLIGFVAADPAATLKAVTGRTAAQGGISLISTIFFLAVVLALYYILYGFTEGFGEEATGAGTIVDLVKPDEFKLSDTTIEMLEALEEPVHVTAFYPPSGEASVRQWLVEYKRYGADNFTFEFIDPDKDPITVERLGASSNSIVFQQGDRTETATSANENSLTSALSRVQLGEERQAYMLTGHGERSLDDPSETGFSETTSLLERANFTVAPLNIAVDGEIPEDADVLIIAGPTAQYAQSEIDAIDAYLAGGGALLVMTDPGQQSLGSLQAGVLAVDYSPDGDLLATAGADGTAKLWDADSGEEVLSLRGHTSSVVDVEFSPDGEQVVTAGSDAHVYIWDVDSGDQVGELIGQTAGVLRVAWSPDGGHIASVGADQTLNVWDAESLAAMPYSPIAVVEPLYVVAFSADGEMVAAAGGRTSGTPSGSAFVYEVESGEAVASKTIHTNAAWGIAFTPDGEAIKTAAVDGSIGTMNLDDAEASTETLYPESGIASMAMMEDGTLVLGLFDGTLHIHAADANSVEDDVVLTGHTDLILDVAVSPDGDHVASAGRDGQAMIWDVDGGEAQLTLAGHGIVDPLISYLNEKWGITVGNDVVIDLPSQQSFNEVTLIVQNYDTGSDITQSLADSGSATVIPVARSVTAGTGPEGVSLTQLLFSNAGEQNGVQLSWAETTDPFSSSGEVNFDQLDIPGPVSLAVSGENSTSEARIVVFGDADFVSNQGLAATTYSNGQLFGNALNWLTQSDIVDIAPADVTAATWDEPFDTPMLAVVQIAITCLIPVIFLVLGGVIWAIRRRRR